MQDWKDVTKIAIVLLLLGVVVAWVVYYLQWSSSNSGDGTITEQSSFRAASNIGWEKYKDADLTGMDIKAFASGLSKDDVMLIVQTKRYLKKRANGAGVFNVYPFFYSTETISHKDIDYVIVSTTEDDYPNNELRKFKGFDGYISKLKYTNSVPVHVNNLSQLKDTSSLFYISDENKYHTSLIYDMHQEVIGILVQEV